MAPKQNLIHDSLIAFHDSWYNLTSLSQSAIVGRLPSSSESEPMACDDSESCSVCTAGAAGVMWTHRSRSTNLKTPFNAVLLTLRVTSYDDDVTSVYHLAERDDVQFAESRDLLILAH